MSLLRLVLASCVMGAGACVQGAVGFGSNIVAAPILLLLDPVFAPGPVSIASAMLNVLIISRREGRPDPGVRWAVGGLVPGTVVGGIVLAVISARGLGLLIGAVVLVAVVLTASGLSVALRPRTLVGAGIASGFMGTVSGIGGPPIALAYQHADGPTLRATLPRFFLIAGAFSLTTLAVVGKLGGAELRAAAALLPGTYVGFTLSPRLARHVDRRTARPIVLALSAVAAVGVLARAVL